MQSLSTGDTEEFLHQHDHKEMLRFLVCGSVDDGKSTLIGRLLLDSNAISSDIIDAVTRDSLRHGTTGGKIDPALITDGLKAEREQGITIDVAYRYFSTAKRKFIIADAPGHEQYTRNMVTGASTANLAVILIDARNGVVEQTKRHSFIASLLGIRHVVVAVNKMDLVDFSQEVFESIKNDYNDFAARLAIHDLQFIPISALNGDNVVNQSENISWYKGGTLMHALEATQISADRNLIDLRFPVQYVNRPNSDYRGYCGTIVSGVVRRGDDVVVFPSGKTTRVKSIDADYGQIDEAFSPKSVTLTLEDNIDVSRGDMIMHPNNVGNFGSKFEAMVVWMDEEPLKSREEYIFKQTARSVSGRIDTVRYAMDINTLRRQDATQLEFNKIGRCAISLTEPIVFDSYEHNRATGSFIIIDRITNATVGAGMILERKLEKSSGNRSFWNWIVSSFRGRS